MHARNPIGQLQNIVVFLSALATQSCSPGTNLSPKQETGVIGNTLESDSDLLIDGETPSSTYYSYDKATDSISLFATEPLGFQRRIKTLTLEKDEAVSVVGASDGAWALELSKQRLRIHKSNGEVTENPFRFSGTPVSAAYNAETGYLVVYDSLQSVGILKLAADGSVEQKTLLGPLLSEETTIVSGDLNNRGELVLALSDNSVAVVSLADTLAEGEWTYRSINPVDARLVWISPIVNGGEDGDGLIVAVSSDATFLIDLDAGTVVAERDIVGTLSRFRSGQPHFYDQAPTQITLVSIKEDLSGFAEVKFPSNQIFSLRASRYIQDQESILVHAKSFDFEEGVYAFRIRDALVTYAKEIDSKQVVALADSFYLVDYATTLGKIEKFDILSENKTPEVVQGFNLGFLQKR